MLQNIHLYMSGFGPDILYICTICARGTVRQEPDIYRCICSIRLIYGLIVEPQILFETVCTYTSYLNMYKDNKALQYATHVVHQQRTSVLFLTKQNAILGE